MFHMYFKDIDKIVIKVTSELGGGGKKKRKRRNKSN